MKQYVALTLTIALATLLTASFFGTAQSSLANGAVSTEKAKQSEVKENAAKARFIPVELFTGAKWNGKHELTINKVGATACATVSGKNRPCDKFYLTGPFKTKTNDTQIKWAGDEIPYYRRLYNNRDGQVESFFTINNSRDGLVRIYDKRKQWGTRTYDGLGSNFRLVIGNKVKYALITHADQQGLKLSNLTALIIALLFAG